MIICVIHVAFVLSVLITNTDSLEDGMHTPMISAPIPAETSPVVSAVLLECPKGSKQSSNASPRSKNSLGEQQLMVNIRVNPSFHIEKVEKFLILDEVYDPHKRTKAKIMSPYLIEISRGEPVMMYPLEFTKSVKLDSDRSQPQAQQTINDTAPPDKIDKGAKTNEKTDKSDTSDKVEKPQSTAKIDKSEISPVQQSINRVIDKIADAIAPAIKIGSSSKKTRQGSKKHAQHINRDYNEEAVDREDQGRQNGRLEHKGKRQMPHPRRSNENANLKEQPQLRIGYLTGYGQVNEDASEGEGQSSSMANVGVERKFVKQLEQQSNFNKEYEGPVKEAGSVFSPLRDSDGECIHPNPEEINKLKISKRDKQTSKMFNDGLRNNKEKLVLNQNHHTPSITSEEDFNPDHELRGIFIPLQRESETGIGIHEDEKEFNDEVNPRNYVQRSNEKSRRKIHDKKQRSGRTHTKRKPLDTYENEDDFYNDIDSNELYGEGSDMDRKQFVRNDNNGCQCKHNQNAQHESENDESEPKEADSDDGDWDIQENGQINNKIQKHYETSHKSDNSKLKARQQNDENNDDTSEDNYEDYDYGNTKQYVRAPQNEKQKYVISRGRQNEPFADMNPNLFVNVSSNKDQKRKMQEFQNMPQQQQWTLVHAPLDLHKNADFRVGDWVDYGESDAKADFRRSNNNNNRNNIGFMQLKSIQINRDNVNGLRKSGIKDPFRNLAENNKYEHQLIGGNAKSEYESNKDLPKTSNYGGEYELKPNGHKANEFNQDLYGYGYTGNFGTKQDTFDGGISGDIYSDKEKYTNGRFDNNGPNMWSYEKGAKENYEAIPSDESDTNKGGTSYRLIPFYDIDLGPQSDVNRNYLKEINDKQMESNSYWNEPSTVQLPLGSVEAINNFYRERPTEFRDNFLNNYNNYAYHASMIPQSMNAAQDLISREPPQFLPPRVPFAKVLADPNLSTNDKVNMIEVMHPYIRPTDDRFHKLTQEMDRSFFVKPYPHPIPFPSPMMERNSRKSPDNTKRKRSFLFYDDLEMRDTLSDNDYNFDNVGQKRSDRNPQRHTEDDAQPCSSCGGKNKKPPGKTDSVPLQGNTCECKNQHSSCSCGSQKTARSVSDTWYSVFNMSAPLPFLTTKLQIFRKRHNTWWKIAPSITLSSLSGIFANANLSILFSSHVDIFQLEKSLRLQNHQLLIPKDDSPMQHHKNSKPSVKKARKIYPEDRIPNLNILNMNPNQILAIDSNKFSFTSLESQSNAVEANSLNADGLSYREKKQRSSLNEPGIFGDHMSAFTWNNMFGDKRHRKRFAGSGIQTVADLGYFPLSMNLLERCPNNKHRLCLNMLDDKVPAYSIKVKMPFRENSIIIRNHFNVKIAKIVTDATTKDALQISVDIINEGFGAHEFSVCVCNCAVPCSVTKSTVKKFLVPHIGETVNFLLPLITESNQKHKKYYCEVVVKAAISYESLPSPTLPETKTNKSKIKNRNKKVKRAEASIRRKEEKPIAIRKFVINPENRCFCVWECNCHCIPKLETHVDFNVCQKLSFKEEKQAGLLVNTQFGGPEADISMTDDEHTPVDVEEDSSGVCDFIIYALILLMIMLLLGLLKAIFGWLCSRRIDRCGFDYIQPGRGYEETSRCRRFFVNTLFFIVFPFVFWCKCFAPSEEDLLVASTEWQCSIANESQSIISENEFKKLNRSSKNSDYSEDEDVLLAQHIDRRSKGSRNSKSSRGSKTSHKSKSSKSRERLGGGQDVYDIDNRLTDLSLAFHDGVFDDDDDEDEEVNTKFILQALVESRESLKKLLRNPSNQQINVVEDDTSKLKEADEFVRALKAAQIVYRTFDIPVGNVRNIPYGIKYCVQGYFLPSLGAEYEFVNYNPMTQYRCISSDGRFIEILRPPVMLCPKEFSRAYTNKFEVLEARDLFLQPPPSTPCINISTMATVATSVAKLASEHSYYKHRIQPALALKDNPHSSVYTYPSQELMLHLEEDEKLTEENFPYSINLEGQDQLDDESFGPIEDESLPIIEDISEEVIGVESHEIVEESLSNSDDFGIDIRKYKCDTIYE